MDKRSKALFEWSIRNATASQHTSKPQVPSSTLDPGVIDAILGPDDATLMRESMVAIKDSSLPLDDRLTAFDNLELLVESIDNASNLEVLKLWPPLIAELSSPEAQIRRYAAWVIGTAVQNNPKAQGHLLQYKAVKRLVEKLGDEYAVRSKAIYALGSQLSHCPAAVKQFEEAGGWSRLRACIRDVEEGTECQRRVAFFVANYLAEDGALMSGLEENGFLKGFVQVLQKQEPDVREKTIKAVNMLISKNIGTRDKETMRELRETIARLRDDSSIDQELVMTLESTVQSL